MLYAQLEIWKTAVEQSPRSTFSGCWTPANLIHYSKNGNIFSPITISIDNHKGSCSEHYSDDEDDEIGRTETNGRISNSKIRSNGSHVHLWQFLKELLKNPNVHGSCIRWVDQNKGIFKIEDSVSVARLWGKRKNRPAMNYDKLSRSIRQYYKKGIMKKTERSQRLVYQFCHPYCL